MVMLEMVDLEEGLVLVVDEDCLVLAFYTLLDARKSIYQC